VYDTWCDFINEYLYDAPWWLECWKSWWWVPWIAIFLLLLLGGGRLWHLATLDTKSHLRIGWIRGTRQKSSRFLRAISDYRVWTFVLVLLGGVGLLGLTWWYQQPRRLLESIGASSAWELSPAGVSLLKQHLWTLWISNVLWVVISVISVGILFIDPYGFNKFYLELSHVGVLRGIKFEGEDWRPRTRQTIRQRDVYVKADGSEFRLEEPDGEGWISLCFDEEKKTLEGLIHPESSSLTDADAWFVEESRAHGVQRAISKGETFCLGTDEEHLSRFEFRC